MDTASTEFATMGPGVHLSPNGLSENQILEIWRNDMMKCGFTYAETVRHSNRKLARAVLKIAREEAVWLFASYYLVRRKNGR